MENRTFGFRITQHLKLAIKQRIRNTFFCISEADLFSLCFIFLSSFSVFLLSFLITCNAMSVLSLIVPWFWFAGGLLCGATQHNAERLLKLIEEIYRWLPLGTIVNNRVFVVHGGISDTTDLDLLKSLDRGKVRAFIFSFIYMCVCSCHSVSIFSPSIYRLAH